MADARKDFETRSGEMYMAFGLNGRFAESFDLEELRQLFEAKYSYPAKEAKVTAGGSTVLVGPISKRT